MSFFKKIGKSVSSAFKKAPTIASSIFKKTGDIAGQVSGGLSKVGDVLGKVGEIGGRILSNPLVEAGATALFGPEAGVGLGLAGQALNMVNQGSRLARGASDVANIAQNASRSAQGGNYSDAIAQGRLGIERARDLRDSAGVAGPMFA